MSDITIALDAGHGGSDPGATYNGRAEKDDTLRLTRAVGKILEMNGINVYYVRDNDEYETPFKKAMPIIQVPTILFQYTAIHPKKITSIAALNLLYTKIPEYATLLQKISIKNLPMPVLKTSE